MGEGVGKLPRGGGCPGQRTPTGNAKSQGPRASRKLCLQAVVLAGPLYFEEPARGDSDFLRSLLSQPAQTSGLSSPKMSPAQDHSLPQPDQWAFHGS